MHQVVISLGSNSDRERNLAAALDALHQQFHTLQISPIYASADARPQTKRHPSVYYNAVIAFRCSLSPRACKQQLRLIENQQQRRRGHTDVSCDLDLLLYDDLVKEDRELTIPHPDMTHCDYLLRPLAELLPNALHPILKKTYAEIWQKKQKTINLVPVDFVWRGKLLSTTSHCLAL